MKLAVLITFVLGLAASGIAAPVAAGAVGLYCICPANHRGENYRLLCV